MVGGADFIKTGDASEKEGLGDAVIGDIIIVCAQVLGMMMMVMIAAMSLLRRGIAVIKNICIVCANKAICSNLNKSNQLIQN